MKALLATLLSLPLSAYAWSMAGHQVIADISWLHLTPQARQAATDLLRVHPDQTRGFEPFVPTDLPPTQRPRWMFRHAGGWPDVARGYADTDPRRHRRFHRGTWHYIKNPLWVDERSAARWSDALEPDLALDPPDSMVPEMNVIQAIKAHRDRLASPGAPAPERALSLAWLLHLIADLHQPLHGVSLHGLTGIEIEGDSGGNLICLRGVGKIGDLHWFWDTRISTELSPAQVETRALELLIAEAPALEDSAADLDVERWMAESVALARRAVYTPELLAAAKDAVNGLGCEADNAGRIALDGAYRNQAQDIAEQRAVLAALRIARLLEQALGGGAGGSD